MSTHGGEHSELDGVGMSSVDGVDDGESGRGGGGEHETGAIARYRRVLTLLPRAYREERGEEMLGVMLDGAQDAGRDRPTPAELLSVLGLSLRLRTGAPGASARARSVGETLRLVTLLGLLLQVGDFAQSLAGDMSVASINPDSLYGFGAGGVGLAVIVICGFLCPFLAMAALLNGRRRLGVLLAANPVVFVLAVFGVFTSDFGNTSSSSRILSLSAVCAVPAMAGLLGFQLGAQRMARPRLWFITMAVIGVVCLAVDYANDRPLGSAWAEASNGFAIGCACLAVGISLSRARRGAIWPVALMVAGAPLLLLLPFTIIDLSYATGISLFSLMTFPGSTYVLVSFYALGAEVLMALIVLAALLRQSLGSPAGRQGQRLPHKQ